MGEDLQRTQSSESSQLSQSGQQVVTAQSNDVLADPKEEAQCEKKGSNDGATLVEQQQHSQEEESSPTSERLFFKETKRPSQAYQQNIMKLEELLAELSQLDTAIREGSLTTTSHVRALLVHEIHKIHSQMPIYLKRRYTSQMPSSMKRVVCVPVSRSSFALRLGASGSVPDLEKTIGAKIREATTTRSNHDMAAEGIRESPTTNADNGAGTATTTTTTTNNSSSVGLRSSSGRSERLHHQRLCASIPSLLSAPKTSYYADHNGSSCSLMTLPNCGGGPTFLNNPSYLYRCDYAQHVRYENGQFTMQERIYLPENPTFKIIGRILGPRGNSLRQLEAETRCRIVIRGKGSVKDPHKEKRLRGNPGWEHLSESLHVLITTQHHDQFVCSRQLHYAVHFVKSLLTPRFDAYKREQLLQLAIINGTYQPRP